MQQSLDKQNVMYPTLLATSPTTLSANELAVLCTLLGGTIQGLPYNKPFTVSAKTYAKVRGVPIATARKFLDRAIETLWDGYYIVRYPETGKVTKFRWIIDISKHDGRYDLHLHPELIPLVTEITKYVSVKLLSIGNFKHKMSYYLYFYIHGSRKNHRDNRGTLVLNEAEFRLRYNVVDTYKGFGELKGKLIKPAIDELLVKGLFKRLDLVRVRGSEHFSLVWESERFIRRKEKEKS